MQRLTRARAVQSEQFLDYEAATREDRCGLRIRVAISAMLDLPGGQSPVFVTDLSVAGFAAEISEQLPIGTLCRLRLPHVMPMQCLVIWSDAGLVGCSFEHLFSPETFESLVVRWQDVGGC